MSKKIKVLAAFNPCVISDRLKSMPALFSMPYLLSAARDAENEIREKLVAAARTLFALHGYRGASVRAIAAAAGVNWSLLSYYFRGQEGWVSCPGRSTTTPIIDSDMPVMVIPAASLEAPPTPAS